MKLYVIGVSFLMNEPGGGLKLGWWFVYSENSIYLPELGTLKPEE